MLSYSDIIKKSYSITVSYPKLWLFGLLTVGAFNLNFLHFENIPLRHLVLEGRFNIAADYLQLHPGALALASLTALVFTALGLVITDWSRIMLILLGESILKDKTAVVAKQAGYSLRSLWTVIKISLLTAVLMLVVAMAVLGPTQLLSLEPAVQTLLLEIGLLVFLPLAFVISCVNIFTVFYVVLYKKSLTQALDLGTDFFISRWTQILGLVAVLIVLYMVGFAVGVALIFLARLGLSWLFLTLARFNILPFSAIIVMLKVIYNALLWALLAGLSVFFNQALLILFLELNATVKAPELSGQTAAAMPSI